MAVYSQLTRSRLRDAWLFLAPMLIVLIAVAGWPLARTIYFGFTDASLDDLEAHSFTGFANYLQYVDYGGGDGEWLGLLADSAWWQAARNTIWFTAISVFFETIFGLMIALVLNANFAGRGVVRAAILIPWAIPTIVSAKMWAWMMHDQFGILNDLFMKIGLLSEPIAWTASPDTAMLAVLIVDIWKTTPFMALLILAALQMVPGDIYEAARIDGVHPVKVFFQLTLPLIRPALMVAIIFRGLDAMRIFDLIYVLTPGNEQTMTMSVFARQNLIDFDRFAYGSAASTLLFVVIAALTIAFMRFARLSFDDGK